MKKQILLLALMLSGASTVFAEEVQIDGLWYNLSGTTAEVIQYKDNVKYSGDIVIPNSVSHNNTDYSITIIGISAFYDCSNLTSITIPNNVTKIEKYAFYGCSGLTSIMIPSSVTTIGDNSFSGCSGLTSITIPSSVTSIIGNSFGGCNGLAAIVVEEGNTRYDSRNNCNAIIETSTNHLICGCRNSFIPNSITDICDNAFWGCDGLTYIVIPSSVTSIGYSAFRYCSGLTSVTLPNSVTSIGGGTFFDCSGLTSVTIPNSVTSIGDAAFLGCSGLTSIIVEDGNTTYDSRNNCNAIIETSSNELIFGCQNSTIPNSVTSIGERAFEGCGGLTSITIPNSVTSIGENSFAYCIGLTSVTIPSSVISIEKGSFTGCIGLISVTIPNSVTSIGEYAFFGCSGLTSVTLPNSVTSIGGGTFFDCSGLTSVTIPNSVTSIGDAAFLGCSGLTSINIPSSVTNIGIRAFRNCSSLTSITIPNSVTAIEWLVFGGCSGLTSITIPNSVTRIVDRAFEGCHDLSDVYCYAQNVPATDSNPFSDTPISNVILHVLPNSIDAYKAATPWSDFKEVVEFGKLDVADLDIITGGSNTQNISLSNSISNLVAFQMDLTLPEGICIDKTGCALSDRITDESQELTIGKLESGAYRITSTSLSLTPISGNDGALLTLKLTADEGCIGGQATIRNIVFSTSESDKIAMSDKTFDISILYNLTYKVDDEEYKTSSVIYGSVLIPEAEPTKEGYTFSGWSEIPSTMPAKDVTVTGTFTVNSYKLTYMVDDKEYKSYNVEYGSSVTTETAPSKEGYTFSGWSEIPASMPAKDVTVTGTFTINSYKLTYMVDDKEYKSYDVEYGSTITPESEPKKEGYIFSGWSEIPETMPAKDVIVTGTFTLDITGIDDLYSDDDNKEYYNLNGVHIAQPNKGINIIKMSDGSIKKVFIR